MLGKFLAELRALLRIRNAFIKCTPGHPARGRAHARAKHVESLQRQSQAVAGVADQVFCRHPAVGELQFADWMGRDHLRPSRHTDPCMRALTMNGEISARPSLRVPVRANTV